MDPHLVWGAVHHNKQLEEKWSGKSGTKDTLIQGPCITSHNLALAQQAELQKYQIPARWRQVVNNFGVEVVPSWCRWNEKLVSGHDNQQDRGEPN